MYCLGITPRVGRGSLWVHQELRDRHVALFFESVPQGTWEVAYELRAEAPGAFHALPAVGCAMYVPEIRGNSREVRLTVTERPRAEAGSPAGG